MPRWAPVHPREPNGSSPDRARAHIQHKLLVAAELERAAASEVDRLSAIAAAQGWTDHELAELLTVDLTTVRTAEQTTSSESAVDASRRSKPSDHSGNACPACNQVKPEIAADRAPGRPGPRTPLALR
jgi:hypothetical protein